jgi:hypothetical protein
LKNKIKILFKLFLKLDYRDKENSGKRKITGIFISYVIANFLLSLNIYNSFDKDSFVILSFSTGLFLLTFVVLNDFSNLFFAKQYIDTLRILPLKDNDVFLSKFLSAFVFIGLIQFSIIIPQSFYYYLYEHNILNTILFIILNFLSNSFIVAVLLFVYTLALYYFVKKANIMLYILQFAFLVYVMYSSSLTSRAMKYGKESILNFGILKLLPQYYFSQSIGNPALLIVCVLVCVIIILLYYYLLRTKYFILSEKIYNLESNIKKPGRIKIISTINNFIYKYVLRNNEERASYSLIKDQLSNSRVLKLRFIPLMFIPVVFTLIAVFADIPGFLYFTTEESDLMRTAGSVLILSPSISITLIMCIRLLVSNTKIADENSPGINWIYDTLPIESIKHIQNGIFKYLYINILIPVILFLFIALCFKINYLTVVLNLAFIISVTLFLNSIFSVFDKKMPFVLEATKYNSASRFWEILLIVLFSIVIIISQIFIFENVIFILISVSIFLIISILLNHNKN